MSLGPTQPTYDVTSLPTIGQQRGLTGPALFNHMVDRVMGLPGAECRSLGGNLTACQVTHLFAPGLYVRQAYSPAGTILISERHRTEHVGTLLAGHVQVWTEDRGWETWVAPRIGITRAGTQRLAYMLAPTLFVTYHPTDLTDILEIEEYLYEPHDEAGHILGS